jgi:hypothetical protein
VTRTHKFFHTKASNKARRNRILSLKQADGTLIHEQAELERMANEFYRCLFSAQGNLEQELVCQFVQRKVTTQMNDELDRTFFEADVEKGLIFYDPK